MSSSSPTSSDASAATAAAAHASSPGLLLALAAGLALLLGALGYRELFSFDPTSIGSGDLESSEAVFFSPTGHAPFFVYTISGWLLFSHRQRFFDAFGSAAPLAPALLLGLAAAGIAVWSAMTLAPDLLLASLCCALLAASWLLGGRQSFRAMLLPALVLLALIPIPAVLINEIIQPVQLLTARLTTVILNAIGVEAVQLADRIGTSGRVFQVIESCSGLRSTQTITLSAILYADLFYRSRKQAALLVLVAPLIGFVVNELRVLSLVFNPYSGFAAVHSAQGLAMLVVGVLAIGGVDALLSRLLAADAAPPRPRLRPQSVPAKRLAVLVGVAALVAIASTLPSRAALPSELAFSPHDLPIRLDGWHSQPLKIDRVYLGSTTFSADTFRRYSKGDEFVDVFVGVSARSRRSSHPLSDKTIALGSGRLVEADGPFDLYATGGGSADGTHSATRAEAFRMRTAEGWTRVVRWHEDIDGIATEALHALLALDRGPGARPGTPRVFRLSTSLGREPDAIATADERLRGFAASLRTSIEKLEERTRNRRERQERARDATPTEPR